MKNFNNETNMVDESYFIEHNDDTVSQLVMIRYPPIEHDIAKMSAPNM